MIELDVKIKAKDIYDFLLAFSYSRSSGIVGSTFGALMMIVAASKKEWTVMVLGIVVLLYVPVTLFFRSRRQALNPVYKKPIHYVFDEEGIAISQGETRQCAEWKDMTKAVSTARSIILYTSARNATIFPNRELGEMRSQVIEMISTHMPPDKVKIRM